VPLELRLNRPFICGLSCGISREVAKSLVQEHEMTKALNWLSARELIKGYKARTFSPVEVAQACLAQIGKHDPQINAMRFTGADTAMEQARASEARWSRNEPLGPLDGVPVLIKDIVLVKGWATTRGSRTTDLNQPWDTDAPCVARLREEGAVFLGMTTTPEFGWKGVTDSPLTGITRNPWNLTRTPGGSSGGSAAALAAGYAPLAIGTDGGGSIRIPAAFTGTFGLKPSFGRVPAWPLSAFGTVAHIGPMTRNVKDAALMLNTMAKPDARDWHALPYDGVNYRQHLKRDLRGLRVAFSLTLGYVDVDPQIAALVTAAVKQLEALGAHIEEVDPGFADPMVCFRDIWWGGARALLGGLPPDKMALLEPALAEVVEQARSLTFEDVYAANQKRGALGSQMRMFMTNYDVLVTPALPLAAFDAGRLEPSSPEKNGKWVNWTPFTYPFNLTQQPAASVPCGFTAEGLPAGLQIVGKMFDDLTVLQVARAYEKVTAFGDVRPAGF
jgi:aspartyl-tRNA(Asn)/glutamyl-tRNA(Gln) amidotransferase subunit A